MSRVKYLEIRDRLTCVKAFAFKLPRELPALARAAGFGKPAVFFGKLDGTDVTYDPFKHKPVGRTMKEAHLWLRDNYDSVESGDVIDVEYILGETDEPKESEVGAY